MSYLDEIKKNNNKRCSKFDVSEFYDFVIDSDRGESTTEFCHYKNVKNENNNNNNADILSMNSIKTNKSRFILVTNFDNENKNVEEGKYEKFKNTLKKVFYRLKVFCSLNDKNVKSMICMNNLLTCACFSLVIFIFLLATVIILKKFKTENQNFISCKNCSSLQRLEKLAGLKTESNKELPTFDEIASLLIKTYNPYYSEPNENQSMFSNSTLISALLNTTTTTASFVTKTSPAHVSIAKKIFITLALITLFTFLIFIIFWIYLKIALIVYDGYKLENELVQLDIKSLEYRKMLTSMSRQLVNPSGCFEIH
jgi:hypothetical protein